MPHWGAGLPEGYPRLPMFPKNLPPMFPPNLPPSGATSTPSGDPMPLGASALAAAAAMAMSPLFQPPTAGSGTSGGPNNPVWNPVLAAAAAAAFASGRFPPPPPHLTLGQKMEEEAGGKDGGSSSRSASPMPLSGTASSLEGLEAIPDGGQGGHHWTFQEQFKQVSFRSATWLNADEAQGSLSYLNVQPVVLWQSGIEILPTWPGLLAPK